MYRCITLALLGLAASTAAAGDTHTTTRIVVKKVCSDAQRQQIRKQLLDGHSLETVRQANPCFDREIAALALEPDLRRLGGVHHASSNHL